MIRKALRFLVRNGRIRWNARRVGSRFAASGVRPNTVAVLKPDLIGDFVVASAYLHDIRRCFPRAEIHLAGHPSWAGLAQWLNQHSVVEGEGDLFDAFIPLSEEQFVHRGAYERAAASMAQYQTILYFTTSRTSALDRLLASLPGYTIASEGDCANQTARANRRFRQHYGKLIPLDPQEPECMRYARFVSGLAPGQTFAPRAPDWRVPPALASEILANVRVRCGLDRNPGAPYIALSPFTSMALKNWPIQNYIKLLQGFVQERRDWRVLVMGTERDRPLAEPLVVDSRVHNLAGRTSLPEAVCVLEQARASVSGDTAAAHMASAVGTPAIVLMGGGQYGRFFPYPHVSGAKPIHILTHDMPCFRCNWFCRHRLFRHGSAPCVGRIPVDAVLDRLLELTRFGQ